MGTGKKQFDHICHRGSDANVLGGALPDDDLAKFRWLLSPVLDQRFILSEAMRAYQGQLSNSYVGFFGNALTAHGMF